VVDRSTLRPGDIVALESDVGGQIGVVTGVSRALDLVHFDDDGRGPQGVVSRPSEELRRVTGLVLGDYVVSGPWFGRVAEVSLHVDVAFDDGAHCTITKAERKLVGAQAKEVDSYTYDLRNRQQMNNVLLYPGQRVAGHSPSVFQASRWIKGYLEAQSRQGTVSRVDVTGVRSPPCICAPRRRLSRRRRLRHGIPTLRNWHSSLIRLAFWYVGDRCFLRAPPSCHGYQHVARPTGGVVVDDESPSARRAHG
jgi:ubiquitin-conjugating enzyme E2 O